MNRRTPKMLKFIIGLIFGSWWLGGFLPLAVGDEIKPEETAVFFTTCGYLDERQQQWIVPIHGWLFEPDADSLAKRFALGTLRRALGIEPTQEEEPVFDAVDGRS